MSEWLEDYLADTKKRNGEREGISAFRQFRFSKKNEEVLMQVRETPLDPHEWTGLDTNSTFQVFFFFLISFYILL